MCIPILTYYQKGLAKTGVHPEDHAPVYSGKSEPPEKREKGLMTKKAIKIDVKEPREKLDPLSRINYAKVYTIEHNVKVLFFGRVADSSRRQLAADYNKSHPPIQAPPLPYAEEPAGVESSQGYAQGGYSAYPEPSALSYFPRSTDYGQANFDPRSYSSAAGYYPPQITSKVPTDLEDRPQEEHDDIYD